jgi:transcriptional regulator with XRE-family HTH domain
MTQSRVARNLGVTQAHISLFERTGHLPQPQRPQQDRMVELTALFEAAGIEFTNAYVSGVRLRKPDQ